MTGAAVPAAAADAGAGPWRRIGAWVGALAGWRRRAFAVVLGALGAASLPPFLVLPALPVALTGLIWLIDASRTRRAAFAVGWWFGFGHFVAGLYWVSESLLVEPEKFAWLIPFAVTCLPAYLALYTGGAAMLVREAKARGWRRIVIFAVAWTVAEWLRGWVLTGFPWNPLALALTISDAAIQPAAWFGAYGLSFLAALIGAAPAVLADPPGARRWPAVAAAGALALAVWIGGAVRLPDSAAPTVPGVMLRIVQGNIAQKTKWDPALRERHFAHYLRLSQAPPGALGPPTDVIWPEAAVPVVFSSDSLGRLIAARVVPPDGLLITGAIRTTAPGVRPRAAWNSLHAIDRAGRIVATYDKFHLVPFGEYVPLRPLLGALGLEAVAADRADFSAGPGPRTLRLSGLPPVSPLICYEAIFSGAVTDPGSRPGWLLNLTNDAWFGVSAGPYQHFASARLRAVEEGLPLVRAANTGISAVFDPYGRVTARLGLDRTGVLDALLPAALPPTLFAAWGYAPLGGVLAIALGVALIRRRQP